MKNWKEKLFCKEVAFCYAVYFQLLLFVTYSIGTLSLFSGCSISSFYFPLALIISCCIFFILLKKEVSILSAFLHVLIANTLLLSAFLISISFFDTSYDGQWYHQPAIIRLAEGWNPILDPFYHVTSHDKYNFLWIQNYPKASWITGAAIYKATGFVESAKLINFITIAAVFFYSYYLLAGIFKTRIYISVIASLLICFNPVTTSQLFSNYVDGILFGMQCLILISLYLLRPFNSDGYLKWKWLMLLSAVIIAANLKFTGLYISAIIIAVFSIYWWKRIRIRIILRRYLLVAAVACLAIVMYGYNPYFTNWHYKGNIFYPLNEKDKYEILLAREPDIVKQKNNVCKLIISICSEASNNPHLGYIHWKNPFSVTQHDIRIFAESDVKLGGFGPLFLLALLLSMITLIFLFGKMTGDQKALLLISISAIILSVILSPGTWRTRYTPQFFLVPIIIMLFGFYINTGEKNIFKKYLPLCILMILSGNILLIARSNFAANRFRTRLIKKEMQSLRSRKGPLLVNFSNTVYQSVPTRLKEAGVTFIMSDTLSSNVDELHVTYKLNENGPVYNRSK